MSSGDQRAKKTPPNQRNSRMAAEIQSVLGELITRGEVRDSRVRGAGIVTITWVRVTGDLSEARAAFTVFGADAAALERVRRGLEAARAYFQQELARRLRARKTVMLSFEIDRSLDNAFRVDSLLRQDAARQASSGEVASGTPGVPTGDDATDARLDGADDRAGDDRDGEAEDEGEAARDGDDTAPLK